MNDWSSYVSSSDLTDRSVSADAISPFVSLSREDFRGFARRLDASSMFVAKLRDRQIVPDTLTPGFRKRVADDLHAPLDVVVAHFAAAQGGAAGPQFYKADGKPNSGGRPTFEEAVRSSGFSAAHTRALLAPSSMEDRESVVSGKRVADRGEAGGWR